MGSGEAHAVSGTFAVGTNAALTNAYAWNLATTPPTAIDLGNPQGGTHSEAQGVSGTLAVGYSYTAGGLQHAYAWNLATTPPTAFDLGNPQGDNTAAYAISGNLAVGYSYTPGGPEHAYAWNLATTPPTAIDLGAPLGGDSYAGAVSGNFAVGASETAGGLQHAYAWNLATTPPTAIDLTPSADDAWSNAVSASLAVGESDTHAYAWDLATTPPTAIDLGAPLGGLSEALSVSGDFAVGASYTAGGLQHAYAWNLATTPPTAIDLGAPLGGASYAVAVSGNFAVGSSFTAGYTDGDAYAWNLATTPPTATDLGASLDGNSEAAAVSGNVAVGASDPGYIFAHAYAWDLGPTPPSSPSATLSTVGDGSVTIGWTAPTENGGSPITGYNVYDGTTSGGESSTPVNPTPLDPSVTGYQVTGLTNGSPYYFTVKAVNAGGSSDPSNEVAAMAGPPLAPTGLTVNVGKGKAAAITLSWTDHGSAISTHEVIVYRYIAATKKNPTDTYTQVVDLTSVSGMSTTVTGLLNKNTYKFKVDATNPAGVGPFSAYSSPFKG